MNAIFNPTRSIRTKNLINNRVIIFIIFFFVSSIRFLFYGFKYFPQLDDYIQYHNLAQSTDFAAVIKNFGLLASRPLSGLSDIFIWSRFWNNMIIAVIILSALWTISAMLFRRVLNNYFNCGNFFVVFYLLLPLNFEGTYWMSASTRIVCGMFFCALSLYLFEKFLSGKKTFLLLWMICQLIAFCYYEQVLALTGFITLFFMLLRLKKGDKSALFALLTFANLAIYFVFIGLNSHGDLSARINIIFPWQEGYFTVFLPELLRQIGAAFIKGGSLTLFKGFSRGVKIAVDYNAWLYISLIILASALVFVIAAHEKHDGRGKYKTGFTVASALLLAFVPLLPYFIILNPWFSMRAVVTSLVGVSLLFDTVFSVLLSKHAKILAAVTAAFVFVAGIASVSELHDYKAAYDYDVMVMGKIAEKTSGTDGRVGILNLNATYSDDLNYYYHEHIHGVIESEWALQGALYANYDDIPEVVPLATDGFSYYVHWNRGTKIISRFEILYWWDSYNLELVALRAEGSDEEGWNLYDPDGRLIAVIWEESPYGYIRPVL